jgi:hypothetical protein
MKGTFYTLEAAIAVAIIITSLAFVFQIEPKVIDLSKANYKQEVYDALSIVDEGGDLRDNVLSNNATAIQSSIDSYVSVNFDVAIFNKTSNLTATPDITSDDIITVSYLISGEVGNYTPREVRVYVWGVG